MTARQFIKAVSDMRSAQKRYFATRNVGALKESKRLENLVDAELARIESGQAPLPEDPELFE